MISASENPSESPIFYTARFTSQFDVKIDTTYSFTSNIVLSILLLLGQTSKLLSMLRFLHNTSHFTIVLMWFIAQQLSCLVNTAVV